MNNGTANDNGYQMPQQIKDISSKILATLMKNNETANIGRPPIYEGFKTSKRAENPPPPAVFEISVPHRAWGGTFNVKVFFPMGIIPIRSWLLSYYR